LIKAEKLEQGPQTPQQDLLNAAFRVFNNREDEAKQEKEKISQGQISTLCPSFKSSGP
jgi:hypothetical protein